MSPAHVLKLWAELGRKLAQASPPRTYDWGPARRLIEAARPYFAYQAGRVNELLKKSNELFHPLQDPLSTNFALHRWLKADREEAYSDWLAWIVEQMEDSREIFGQFGVDPPENVAALGKHEVIPEHWVEQGHLDRTGRIDILIRWPGQALLGVEVKVTDADSADTAKQAGYRASLNQEPETYKPCVLLATDGEETVYEGFGLYTWKELCLQLRRLARHWIQQKKINVAALTLGFVGAVEQNLLGMSIPGNAGTVLLQAQTSIYLDHWLLVGETNED